MNLATGLREPQSLDGGIFYLQLSGGLLAREPIPFYPFSARLNPYSGNAAFQTKRTTQHQSKSAIAFKEMAVATQPISTSLEQARQHHAAGNLLLAAGAYSQTLQTNPGSQPALLALSLIARQSGQLQPALTMAQAAVRCPGDDTALAWSNYGDLLNYLKQSDSAESAFQQAIALEPTLAAAHYGQGNARALQDEFESALSSFETAARLAPHIPETHFAIGFAYGKLGRHGESVVAYRRAVRLRPNFASAWLNLAVALIADGRDQFAELCYRQALASSVHAQTTLSGQLNLGHLYRAHRNFPKAEESYEQALLLAPTQHGRHAEVQIAFTFLHLEQQHFAEAWEALKIAQSVCLDDPEIANARGILLLAEEAAHPDPEAVGVHLAVEAFLVAETRNHPAAASNRGNALLQLGRCELALEAQLKAHERNPHHPGIHYNLALTQLRVGDYAEGWVNYESRWRFREVHPRPRHFSQPRWRREPNAILFLYAEQGLGDTLQFIRYLPLVLECGPARVIVEVQPALMRLLTPYATQLNFQLIAQGSPLPGFTHHSPLLSLPALFQTTLLTVPSVADLRQGRAATGTIATKCKNIGLNWAGNPNYRADKDRSTSLETFLPILDLPGFQFISLQKGKSSEIAAYADKIEDASAEDQDLADTAALMADLDLVITTDTAIAHLAGSLGKPLWLLLPWQSDWRWMQHTLTTPWYSTARLFRQGSRNNWAELIDRVCGACVHSQAGSGRP